MAKVRSAATRSNSSNPQTAEGTSHSIADPLDEAPEARRSVGEQELRAAYRAQRDRALGFTFSAIVAILANRLSTLDIDWPAAIALLAASYLSTLAFAFLARRSFRRYGRVNLVSWWLGFDVLAITAMVVFTGGLSSPWWIWYLACAGTAVLHRGRVYVVLGAVLTAALYLGVLVAAGQIHGLDPNFFVAVSRLVFMGCASAALLLNTRRLRESAGTIRRLKDEAEARSSELKSANRELQRLNSDLEDMATLLRDMTLKDPLTGLRNRRYLQERFADEAAKRSRGPKVDRRSETVVLGAGLVMLDLDGFSEINGNQGQAVGDLALKHAAQMLAQSVRADDMVIRWGSDEFVVLLARIEAARMKDVAEKLQQAVPAKPLRLPDGTAQTLTATLGWAFVDQEARSQGVEGWEKALSTAESVLHATKRAGKRGGPGAGRSTGTLRIAQS